MGRSIPSLINPQSARINNSKSQRCNHSYTMIIMATILFWILMFERVVCSIKLFQVEEN
jgi:hypothetical protein